MFVVQKHAATRLHYDFRLEHDGVLKSWAVPKGPSLDPEDKRLAVEVEDHPIEYGGFEGVIPPGEYGGGTVLLWDRGRWTPETDVNAGLRKGHLRFRLHGEKLRGAWNLVRLRDSADRRNGRPSSDKPTWLLIKSQDEEARPKSELDIVTRQPQSVHSHRDLEEIAKASDRVWHSNRPKAAPASRGSHSETGKEPPRRETIWRERVEAVRPMLATLEDAPLDDEQLIYEPKYDGIRALANIEPSRGGASVRIWSRLGNEKTAQFPEIVRVLKSFGRGLKAGVLLDGEIVALDTAGNPAGFQQLQGRVHLTTVQDGEQLTSLGHGIAFMLFDILRDGDADLRPLPLVARRARLERVLKNVGSIVVRLSEFQPRDGRALYQQAIDKGWEGVIAKMADSPYRSGRRSADWRKLKIVRRQEFVIGGWTEPRQSRSHFGALLLGVYDHGQLQYVGHTGTGFTEKELKRVSTLLRKLERPTAPFAKPPRPNEKPHWIEPRLVAEIKFTEWTTDGKLRHPVYLGLRDDIDPVTVRREPTPALHPSSIRDTEPRGSASAAAPLKTGSREQDRPRWTEPPKSTAREQVPPYRVSATLNRLLDQIDELRQGNGSGVLALPNGETLAVGHLSKVFWPQGKITKGELLRYYIAVSPLLLPAVADRPMVMRRFPNGIAGKAFYQQRAPEQVPAGVRVETLPVDEEVPSRVIGGSLITLLYMAQLAVISQDPWFSRVQSIDAPDYVALDLDPMPGVVWPQVLNVARWAHEELERLGVPGYPKTSGASGLHIYIPLKAGTPYEAGRLFCQMVATLLAHKHPKAATVERSVHARGQTVYVDYLQNIQGKTLATAYSARASHFAGVSTPLNWDEIDRGVKPEEFTLRTALHRFAEVGDLWALLRRSPGVDLRAVLERAGRKL